MPIPHVDPNTPPSLLKRVITPIALTRAGTWFLKNVSRRVDPTLVRLTRGRVSTIGFTPVVLLTTTGARTGLPRTTPLLYFSDGDGIVLMASNYGGTKHPAWYHNVRANPEVTALAGGQEERFRARVSDGAERDRLWALAKQLTRGYAQYEVTTDGREIPVVVCDPVLCRDPKRAEVRQL